MNFVRMLVVGLVAVCAVCGIAEAQYPNGFVWRHLDDYRVCSANGGAFARGNPNVDAVGSPVWSYEYGSHSARAWYANASPRLLVCDLDYLGTGPRWVVSDNQAPSLGPYNFDMFPGGIFAQIRWTNLLGRTIAVSIADEVSVHWYNGATATVDLVVAVRRHSTGNHEVLWSSVAVIPQSAVLPLEPIALQSIPLAPNDSIILSAQGRPPSGGWITIATDFTLILTNGGDCTIDADGDRAVTFADITAILGNWGAICP